MIFVSLVHVYGGGKRIFDLFGSVDFALFTLIDYVHHCKKTQLCHNPFQTKDKSHIYLWTM